MAVSPWHERVMNDSLNRLTRWLCGSFSNQQQAFTTEGARLLRMLPGAGGGAWEKTFEAMAV